MLIGLSQVSCNADMADSAEEVSAKDSICNCNDVFLDPAYNYFYTEKREEPFSGVCESYYPNGQVSIHKQFDKGRLEGMYLEYYESGILKSEWSFSKGRYHGSYKGFYPDGNLKYHSIFYKGDQDSIVFP